MKQLKFRTYLEGIGFKYFNIGEEAMTRAIKEAKVFCDGFEKKECKCNQEKAIKRRL